MNKNVLHSDNLILADSFKCTTCNSVFPLKENITYTSEQIKLPQESFSKTQLIRTSICPQCKQTYVHLLKISFAGFPPGYNAKPEEIIKLAQEYPSYCVQLYPFSDSRAFPIFIPYTLTSDYNEALSIVNLSPKASATLSRRCLEFMISDFFGINERTLHLSIEKLNDENLIPDDIYQAIKALKNVGNIGAHFREKSNEILDVEPEEALTMIRLLDFLIEEWYISRNKRLTLLESTKEIGESKKI